MPYIPESRFFGGKVHSRQALRFGRTSHQALRDLRSSGPPASTISQTDKTLLPEGRGAGSAGWSNRRSGRWAEPRWGSEPEKRKWHCGGIQWLSGDCPFKLWNACANLLLWATVLVTPFYSYTWNISWLYLPQVTNVFFKANLIATGFK